MAKILTEGGIKECFLDPETAAQLLTPKGWEKYVKGEILQAQDAK